MARTASGISTIPDLPPPLSALGASGQTGARSASAAGRVTGARKLDLEEAFIDATFARAKKGLAVRPTKPGKGTKILALADEHSLPLAVSIESTSPHESQLVEGVVGQSFLDVLPARLIGDKAYDQRPVRLCSSER